MGYSFCLLKYVLKATLVIIFPLQKRGFSTLSSSKGMKLVEIFENCLLILPIGFEKKKKKELTYNAASHTRYAGAPLWSTMWSAGRQTPFLGSPPFRLEFLSRVE